MPTLVSESSTQTFALWTANDFLDWLEPGKHADLIDGEKSMHSPVSLPHADLINFLDRLIAAYVEPRDLGRLYREVVAVKLSSRNVFLPDLCFIPHNRLVELPGTHIPFAPPFVVEALSPRTANRDVGPKFAAYEEHGVNEYWILDPDTLAHRFYRRDGELLVEYAEGAEWVDLIEIPGFRIKREWLNPSQLAKVADCLAEIAMDRDSRSAETSNPPTR